MFKMKNRNTSTNRIEVKESKSEMLKSCRYGYGNFKKQKTIIPSNNMILNTSPDIALDQKQARKLQDAQAEKLTS